MNWLEVLEPLEMAVKLNLSFYKEITCAKGKILISKLAYTKPEIIVLQNNIIIFRQNNLSAYNTYDLAREFEAYLNKK